MKRPEILVETGELAGRRFAVGESVLRLGRSSSNDIHVQDEELSRNHCLFEQSGEADIRITDLASANGTFVNGDRLGAESRVLSPGDVIDVGKTRLRVVGENEAAPSGEAVDLGFARRQADAPQAQPGAAKRRRSPLLNVMWVVAAAALIAAICLVLSGDGIGGKAKPAPVAATEESESVVEMRYEKVVATSESIFRYYMEFLPDGTLRVAIDDVPGENRHVNQPKHLGAQAIARLNEILLDPDLLSLDRQYVGPDGEPPELRSWSLTVVYSGRVRTISIVNTVEPEAFRRVREKLETFTKNELGIWAIQCSRAQLVELAAASAETGRMKWEDRDVEHGNLHAAICAYREAIVYLDTVNPKPPEFAGYREAKERAEKELDSRYREQRFKVDRAINLSDWDTARTELQVLRQMVPDRDDDRNREAAAKLVDVEKRIKNGGRR